SQREVLLAESLVSGVVERVCKRELRPRRYAEAARVTPLERPFPESPLDVFAHIVEVDPDCRQRNRVDLRLPAAEGGPGRFLQCRRLRAQPSEDGRCRAAWLVQQDEQQMLGAHVAVAES